MFAESAGKKGGDFYTPRDVIRLMVRILKPAPGMSVYDPTCGSGGMLIISREFIEQSGGDPTNLRLCGQVNDASAWSICKLNMLLHGVPGADIQLEDTLLHPHAPRGRRTGTLRPRHRQSALQPELHPQQHGVPRALPLGLVSHLGQEGRPHVRPAHARRLQTGRHGRHRHAPRRALSRRRGKGNPQEVPRTGPHRGRHRPAAEPVLRRGHPGLHSRHAAQPHRPARPTRTSPPTAGARCSSSMPTPSSMPAARRTISARSTSRKSSPPSTATRTSPATPASSRSTEIASEANDFNLNIRRYVDNSPPPEPHDVRAHLLGGVPVAEVSGQTPAVRRARLQA